MSKFSKCIDRYNKIFLNESTNNESSDASFAMEQLLKGKLIFSRSKIDNTIFYVGDETSSKQIMMKVVGFKNDDGAEIITAAPVTPTAAPTNLPDEEEEKIVDDVNKDPAVITAKQNAAQKVLQLLNKQKADAIKN